VIKLIKNKKLPFKRERLDKILELLNEKNFVSIEELQSILNVSTITIRRDIKELESRMLVQKVYGGIRKIDSNILESRFTERRMMHAAQKIAIAKTAAQFVNDGDTIFIDSSSTAFEFVRFLKENFNDIHMVTNSLMSALELLENPTCTITLIGGTVRTDNISSIGMDAEEMMKHLNAEKAFISCRAFMPSKGTFEISPAVGIIKRAMAENSNKVYLLVDDSKFFKRSTFMAVPIDDINIIVTNDSTGEIIKELPKHIQLIKSKE
jgi:DeoR/GlpR family transcriptional regulator of sugar metabolism